jgi:hypothetical protein
VTGARIENARDEKRGRDGRRVFEVDKARLVWQRSAARARPLVKRKGRKSDEGHKKISLQNSKSRTIRGEKNKPPFSNHLTTISCSARRRQRMTRL